jgi:transcriptional regulator GlxA family with amidase domain
VHAVNAAAMASMYESRQDLKTMPKQDRRAERTRAALMRSFIELVLANGYEAVTIDATAARAKVGRSTFYTHYRSKEEIQRQRWRKALAALPMSSLPVKPIALNGGFESIVDSHNAKYPPAGVENRQAEQVEICHAGRNSYDVILW